MDACRTCLAMATATDVMLKPIHRKIIVSNEYIRISEILDTLYGYQVKEDDELPQLICNDCTYQLTMAYSFKYLIEASANAVINGLLNTDDNISEHDDDKMLLHTVKGKKSKRDENTKCYCTKCSEEFKDSLQLFNHCMADHQTESTYGRPCDFCNERFPDLPSLIHHRMQHMSRHICSKCWSMFNSHNELVVHVCNTEEAKTEIQDQWHKKQCDQCGKSYPRRYFKMHTLIHSKDYKYSCSYCPMKFKVPCGLNSHVLWKHKRTRNHPCSFCDATFITASARSSHTRKLHLKERTRICESCGKSLFSKSELDRHMLTHTGERNFGCEMCSKAYQTRSALNLHLRSHSHRQSEEWRSSADE